MREGSLFNSYVVKSSLANVSEGATYQQMQQAQNAFAGVSFHDYSGTVSQQDTFHSAYPSKEIYFTEGTGTFGSDWWSDIKVGGTDSKSELCC